MLNTFSCMSFPIYSMSTFLPRHIMYNIFHYLSFIYKGDSINKVTRPLMCVMFLISFKFPARSEQVEHCFLSRTLDSASYQSYCPNISCKMAGLVETWSNIEVRSVIRFLWLKGIRSAEIHHQLVEVYGANVMSQKHIWVCCTAFENGRPHSQPHAWVVTVLQLGGSGPSSLQPWPGTKWFSSLWAIEEAPGWKGIHNWWWSSASHHVLASGAWHWFLLG
jgi:hypothetical protein